MRSGRGDAARKRRISALDRTKFAFRTCAARTTAWVSDFTIFEVSASSLSQRSDETCRD